MFHKLEPIQIDFAGKKVIYTFSNWTLSSGQMLTIDPTTSTYYSEAALDGWIYRYGFEYPPTSFIKFNKTVTWFTVGQQIFGWYIIHRSYLSFDTSSIPDDAILISGMLRQKLCEDWSITDFTVKLYSGSYGDDLTTDDWDAVTTSEGNFLDSTNGISVGTFYNKSVSISSINITGRSQYKLTSNREEDQVQPTENEYIDFWSGDTGVSYWRPKLEVTYYYKEYPTNDSLNLDLTGATYKGAKTLLTYKQDYKFVLKVTDNDGVTNLHYVEIRYPSKNVVLRATKGTGDTWSFSESDPNDYVTLGASSHSTSGNQKTFNFMVKINWVWGDSAETVGVQAYSKDQDDLSDTDNYSNVFGVEHDLSSSSLTVSDSNRVNPGQALTMSGYWYYEGTTIYPPDGDYQVNIKLSGIQKGSTDTTLVNGAFSIDINAESGVGSYSYNVEATYMVGAGTFSAVIVDKIIVTITSNSTNPTNTQAVQLTTSAKYQYDNADVTTLSFQMTRNGSPFATSTPVTDGPYSDIRYVYTITSASETTHGLNTFSTNTITVTWGVNVFIEGWQIVVDDARADVSSNVYLRYRLRFGNNQSAVGSGTIWINGASHMISNGWANFTVTSASVGKLVYVETDMNVNGEKDYTQIPANPYIIWDRFEFVSVTTNDIRINIGAPFELRYVIRYDYDNVPFGSAKGSVSGFTWDLSNGWWKKTLTGQGIAASVNYDETYISIIDSTYGLSAKQDVSGVNVITDGLKVSDQQIDLSNEVLKLRLIYAYDNSSVPNGNVTFAGVYGMTNSSGWASLNLDSLSDFAWGLSAFGVEDDSYGISYKAQNQTTPLLKVAGILVQTETGLILDSYTYQNSQLNLKLTGSGSKFVRVKAPKPYYVKVGTLLCLEGQKWTYNTVGGYTEITESYSTQTIFVSWIPFTIDTSGTSGSSEPEKTFQEEVVEAVSAAVLQLSSNFVGAIVFVLAVVGCVLAWFYEQKALSVILAFVTTYLLIDLIAVFVLMPQMLFPAELMFLQPLLWVPPPVALEMFGGLAAQQLVQAAMMGSLFIILGAAIYGVSQR